MSKLLRDVMNSKSDKHFRHSEDAYDIKKLSFYYAIESRIFNSIWNEELKKYTRGPLWFTNIMVFDFDYDEEHFPNVDDYERKLNESLEKLTNILGTPKYKIYNKQKFTKWEKEVYFTKNGEVKLPKKYGCQVVYELDESLQSQYVERVKLYNSLRLHISSLVDADLNFKGHMFKNPYNDRLFNIEESQNHNTINIFDIAKSLNFKNADKIKSLKPFETLNDGKKLPEYLRKWNNMLFGFYQELNSWKSNNWKVNWKNKVFYMENCKKSDSRNETLFEYFKTIPLSTLETITYGETINSNLFDGCAIKEPLDEVEWENTKQSVLNYRKENNIEWVDSNVDNRVFKWNQNPLNLNFFNENEEILFNFIGKSGTVTTAWLDKTIDLKLYNGDNPEEILSNVFLSFGPGKILTNIRSLISPDMLEFYKQLLKNTDSIYMDFGMYDLYCIIKGALYLTHFKYYRSVQDYRHLKIKDKFISKSEKREQLLNEWGLNYEGNIIGFKKFYNKLKKHGLLKEDGSPLPILLDLKNFIIN